MKIKSGTIDKYCYYKKGEFMKQIFDAVYQNGVFKPKQIPEISQGQKVRLIVETLPKSNPNILDLATKVYDGLEESQVDKVEQIALDRGDFFGGKKD